MAMTAAPTARTMAAKPASNRWDAPPVVKVGVAVGATRVGVTMTVLLDPGAGDPVPMGAGAVPVVAAARAAKARVMIAENCILRFVWFEVVWLGGVGWWFRG